MNTPATTLERLASESVHKEKPEVGSVYFDMEVLCSTVHGVGNRDLAATTLETYDLESFGIFHVLLPLNRST